MLALLGLYGFCLSIGPSVAGINVFTGVILLATVLAGGDFWRDVKALPVFWLMLAFLAYITVQSLVFTHAYPVLEESRNPHWTHVARTAGLISLPMAWWMARFPRNIPWLLGIAGLSLALGLVYAVDVSGLVEHGIWRRHFWGSTQGEVSYVAAIGLLGCWLLSMRFFLRCPPGSWHVRVTAPLLALAGCAFLIALYGSQTRSTWGAAAITLGLFITLEVVRAFRRREALLRVVVVIVTVVLALSAVLSLDGGRAYEQRLGGESGTLKAMLELDSEQVYKANPSLGIRLLLWEEGVRAIKEKPVVGWGVGGLRRVEQTFTDSRITGRSHFHNIYIQLLVGVGFVGVLLLAAILYLLLRRALAVGRCHPEQRYLIQLASAGLLLTSLTLFFEIRLGHTAGRAIMIFLLALLAVQLWHPRQVQRKTSSPDA